MLQRRQWMQWAVATTASMNVATAAQAQSTFDALTHVKALRLTSGPYTGGYLIAPGGYLNWYFVNLGLYPFVASIPADVRSYLDLYLAKVNTSDWTIRDVLFNFGTGVPVFSGTQASDSDDSYAATFLSLAVRYVQVTGNTAWWTANLAKLKAIAYYNLAVPQKPASGLTQVFQDAGRSAVGYLMDNCEAHRGVRDFATLLATRGDAEAAYYHAVADGIRAGIAGLYRSAQAAFRPSDAHTAVGYAFYPDGSCQLFPQAFDALSGVSGAAALLTGGWNYLNTQFAGWETGRYDRYPWMVLGWAAAQRGQVTPARTQMAMMVGRFTSDRPAITINELGFYQRIVDLIGP